MPNIEIHGRPDAGVRKQIWQALKGMSGLHEVVVTDMCSSVFDLNGVPAPFLRLLYTPETRPEELKDIEKRLDHIDLDLEVCPLKSFREKKSAREKKFWPTKHP